MPSPKDRLFALFDALPPDHVPGLWLREFGYKKAERVYAAALAEWLNQEINPDFSPFILRTLKSALKLRALDDFQPKHLCFIKREDRMDILLTGDATHLLLVIRLFHWIETDWSACAELGMHEPRDGRVIKVALSLNSLEDVELRSAGFVQITFESLLDVFITELAIAGEPLFSDQRTIAAAQLFLAAAQKFEDCWPPSDAFGRISEVK